VVSTSVDPLQSLNNCSAKLESPNSESSRFEDSLLESILGVNRANNRETVESSKFEEESDQDEEDVSKKAYEEFLGVLTDLQSQDMETLKSIIEEVDDDNDGTST
jgi:hypothetical protein